MYQIWKGAMEIVLIRQLVEKKFTERVWPILEFLVIITLFHKAKKPWWRYWFLAQNAAFLAFGKVHTYSSKRRENKTIKL